MCVREMVLIHCCQHDFPPFIHEYTNQQTTNKTCKLNSTLMNYDIHAGFMISVRNNGSVNSDIIHETMISVTIR